MSSIKGKAVSVIAAVFLVACGGGSGGGSGSSESTAAIAGTWDVIEGSALGFDIIEINADGSSTQFYENAFDNCYRATESTLTNEGDDLYGIIVPALGEEPLIYYTLVNEGDSLRYTSSFLGIDESWPALEGISTSDFNICEPL